MPDEIIRRPRTEPERGRELLKQKFRDILEDSPLSVLMGVSPKELELVFDRVIEIMPQEEVERDIKALPLMKRVVEMQTALMKIREPSEELVREYSRINDIMVQALKGFRQLSEADKDFAEEYIEKETKKVMEIAVRDYARQEGLPAQEVRPPELPPPTAGMGRTAQDQAIIDVIMDENAKVLERFDALKKADVPTLVELSTREGIDPIVFRNILERIGEENIEEVAFNLLEKAREKNDVGLIMKAVKAKPDILRKILKSPNMPDDVRDQYAKLAVMVPEAMQWQVGGVDVRFVEALERAVADPGIKDDVSWGHFTKLVNLPGLTGDAQKWLEQVRQLLPTDEKGRQVVNLPTMLETAKGRFQGEYTVDIHREEKAGYSSYMEWPTELGHLALTMTVRDDYVDRMLKANEILKDIYEDYYTSPHAWEHTEGNIAHVRMNVLGHRIKVPGVEGEVWMVEEIQSDVMEQVFKMMDEIENMESRIEEMPEGTAKVKEIGKKKERKKEIRRAQDEFKKAVGDYPKQVLKQVEEIARTNGVKNLVLAVPESHGRHYPSLDRKKWPLVWFAIYEDMPKELGWKEVRDVQLGPKTVERLWFKKVAGMVGFRRMVVGGARMFHKDGMKLTVVG